MQLLLDATSSALAVRAALGVLVAVVIAAIGVRSDALTRSGAIATVIVGTATFAFGGPILAAALILFFASGSALSHISSPAAQRARSHAQKQGRRDAMQVVANGGVATVCAVVAGVLAWSGGHERVWLAAAIGALGAASGDTWSTELGSLFGGTPRSITSFRPVEAGTSGGITLVGLIAAVAGGACVGVAGLILPISNAGWIGLAAVAGLAGSISDSILGATRQALWRCPRCGRVLEGQRHADCAGPADLVRGWAWLDNDGVNLLATMCGAVCGAAVASLLART